MVILAFALPVIAFNDNIIKTHRIFSDAFEIQFDMPRALIASRRFKEKALLGTFVEECIGSVD